ncbi:MAG: glyoxylate/hydroxypyruvate reductase A [Betaproteobacteria bacterium]|nr:glyoxylate/hydroxypyruvate reductase A [Betaproteobacteria bacterium]
MNVAFLSTIESPDRWLPLLEKALPQERFFVWPEIGDPAAIDIAFVAVPPAGALARLPNLKLVQSLWMGVDGLLAQDDLPRHVPLARCIDRGMVAAMCESVLSHVIDFHRHHYVYRRQQSAREWNRLPQSMAADRTVGLLGLGELGGEAGPMLRSFGFRVRGWSRRPKSVIGVESCAGSEGLARMLPVCNVVVCLLPLTPETRGILNAATLALMPRGGAVINVARGAHVVDEDLLAALDSGQVARAYLDVFETEPLPVEHRYWTHPGVFMTPHTAALTEPRTATAMVVENINRLRNGLTPLALVDVEAGY